MACIISVTDFVSGIFYLAYYVTNVALLLKQKRGRVGQLLYSRMQSNIYYKGAARDGDNSIRYIFVCYTLALFILFIRFVVNNTKRTISNIGGN